MIQAYPSKITKDKQERYFVRFLDFDEAVTDGESMEEALFNAQEVLTLTIEGRMDEGIDIPDPRQTTGKTIHFITPAARVQAALLVHRARGNRSLADQARALETSWP
ncbi:MAG: type II toxin-antitoxin system HicB family antitoxin [Desulfobulbaceae bacterium]|jgi:antitoxin HicB